jgi:hypothetical protein
MEEIKTKGVEAGENIFVGGGTFSGESGITMLAPHQFKCYYPYGQKENVLLSCVYLVNEPGNFIWIPSSFGKIEDGAVMYKGVAAGRCKHEGHWRVGKIWPKESRMYYSFHHKEHHTSHYEALIYIPHLKETRSTSSTAPAPTTSTTDIYSSLFGSDEEFDYPEYNRSEIYIDSYDDNY